MSTPVAASPFEDPAKLARAAAILRRGRARRLAAEATEEPTPRAEAS